MGGVTSALGVAVSVVLLSCVARRPVTAADESIRVTVVGSTIEIRNLTDTAFAYTAYDRNQAAIRSSDRDPCTESPTAQCPLIEARGVLRVNLSSAIGQSSSTREVLIRYWNPSRGMEYPGNVRTVVVVTR